MTKAKRTNASKRKKKNKEQKEKKKTFKTLFKKIKIFTWHFTKETKILKRLFYLRFRVGVPKLKHFLH